MAGRVRGTLLRSPTLVPGICILGLGVFLPWLDIPLYGPRPGWRVPLFFTGITAPSALSYSLIALCCAGVAALGTARSRGRSNAWTGMAGIVALCLPLFLIFQTMISDVGLFRELAGARRDYGVLGHMYGYPNLAMPPTNLLVWSIQGPWADTLADLRLGAYLTGFGGLLLLCGCGGALRRAFARRRRTLGVTLLAAVGFGLLTIGRGGAANVLVSSAASADLRGDYAAASQQLEWAAHLNPAIRKAPQYRFALADIVRWRGNPASPLALLADSLLQGNSRRPDLQLNDLRLAAAGAPDDPVITDELLRVARTAAVTQRNPTLLLPYVDQPWGDLPSLRYTLGQIYFDRADYPAALLQFQRLLALTPGNADAQSAAYTRIALAEAHLGRFAQSRHHILRAVALDARYVNSIARSLAVGLFAPSPHL